MACQVVIVMRLDISNFTQRISIIPASLVIFSHCLRFLNKVVDTSVVFPHLLGPPYKRALRNLMAEHLKKIIQDSGKF